VTTFDLRKLRLRSGDQAHEQVEIELEPLVLGGQAYAPKPDPVPAQLIVTRASSGTVLELSFAVTLEGPCFRCLQDADLALSLDLSSWAHDAIALALPDKILCREDCAGLCPVCGKDLNEEPHEHADERTDPRWEKLSRLREEA
jgi:uncharacterized protein